MSHWIINLNDLFKKADLLTTAKTEKVTLLCLNCGLLSVIFVYTGLLYKSDITQLQKKHQAHQPFQVKHIAQIYMCKRMSFTLSSLLPLVIAHSEVTTWPSRRFSFSLSSLFFSSLLFALKRSTHISVFARTVTLKVLSAECSGSWHEQIWIRDVSHLRDGPVTVCSPLALTFGLV